ncbi:hypothetical protein [Planococcus sp. ANT_H30]|uniref:hypothetical protein n=1 Tax=Planococcus sp. ANT_H30 TaxID=2597347 RepID=UPI00165D57E9|nr:hypothetical protein [Planococcus sp. ANT_H30]
MPLLLIPLQSLPYFWISSYKRAYESASEETACNSSEPTGSTLERLTRSRLIQELIELLVSTLHTFSSNPSNLFARKPEQADDGPPLILEFDIQKTQSITPFDFYSPISILDSLI